jgi:hypothetical protein
MLRLMRPMLGKETSVSERIEVKKITALAMVSINSGLTGHDRVWLGATTLPKTRTTAIK